MNVLEGTISSIISEGDLSLVRVKLRHTTFSSIVLETSKTVSHLIIGGPINLIFKETEVAIAKMSDLKVSIENKILGVVANIESGVLLSRVKIRTEEGMITSVVTTNVIDELGLKENDEILALIKTNEIMLSK